MLVAARNGALEKIVQPELSHQFQPQPRAAEVAAVLEANLCGVDFDPLGLDVVEQPLLPRPPPAQGRVLDAQPATFVQLPHIRHDPLPRTTRGAIRLHQRPVGVPFAVFAPITGSEKHAGIVARQIEFPSSKVFTTTPRDASRARPPNTPQQLAREIPTPGRASNTQRIRPNRQPLANLG